MSQFAQLGHLHCQIMKYGMLFTCCKVGSKLTLPYTNISNTLVLYEAVIVHNLFSAYSIETTQDRIAFFRNGR